MLDVNSTFYEVQCSIDVNFISERWTLSGVRIDRSHQVSEFDRLAILENYPRFGSNTRQHLYCRAILDNTPPRFMNLKSFSSRSSDARSTCAHPHSMGQHKLNRSIVASLLSLAAVATVSQPEQAAAIDLNFSTIDTALDTTTSVNYYNFGFGPGVASNVIHYKNVYSGVDAVVTATVTGANYSFSEHIYNYSANTAGQPTGDAAFFYQIAPNSTGLGTMNYKIDLFASGSNYSTAYVASDLRLFAYDIDGEAIQGESLRVAKDTGTGGLVGYQIGTAANALIVTDNPTNYLFSGRDANLAESNTSGGILLYFQNTSSVNLQFEANTRTASAAATGLPVGSPTGNPVFSAIDGDVSLIGNNATNFDASGRATTAAGFGTYQTATKIPEPFTIIGSLIGGGVAFRMRKKLKATSK
jgi:hypothetical protein